MDAETRAREKARLDAAAVDPEDTEAVRALQHEVIEFNRAVVEAYEETP